MNLAELAQTVVVRNHLESVQNGTRNTVSRPQLRQIGDLILRLDQQIVQESLVLFSETAPVEEKFDFASKIAEAKAAMVQQKAERMGVAPTTTAPEPLQVAVSELQSKKSRKIKAS